MNNIESEIKKTLDKYEQVENKRIESKYKRIKIKAGWNTIKGSKIAKRSINNRYDPIYVPKQEYSSYSRIIENAVYGEDPEKAIKLLKDAKSLPRLERVYQ